MEGGGGIGSSDVEREDEDAATDILRDRFRLCTISIAEAEAKQNNMEISQPIMTCIADLAFKYAGQSSSLSSLHATIGD
ncbi:histone superfamily protein [Actinidia rufa]|uniref:Histone superfamily protein n=1 Tax=Actinidia rufa TaxID=165716 RepID=A0A7J0H2S3_9ERIC|nr:histone superfamily protein [Actinidia rufa]